MTKEFKVPEFRCSRCGHTWIPRISAPKRCPRCKSYYWTDQWDVRARDKRILEQRKRRRMKG